MRKFLVILGLFSLCVGSVIFGEEKMAGDAKEAHVLVKPDTIKWGPPPPGLPAGSQVAVVLGDPGKAELFVLQAKFRDGYRIMPHWHSMDENVTVLKGVLMVGHGDKAEAANMEEAPAGSFWHMPSRMRHFVTAKGETIVQIQAMGPFDITYINPADDPRGKETKN